MDPTKPKLPRYGLFTFSLYHYLPLCLQSPSCPHKSANIGLSSVGLHSFPHARCMHANLYNAPGCDTRTRTHAHTRARAHTHAWVGARAKPYLTTNPSANPWTGYLTKKSSRRERGRICTTCCFFLAVFFLVVQVGCHRSGMTPTKPLLNYDK